MSNVNVKSKCKIFWVKRNSKKKNSSEMDSFDIQTIGGQLIMNVWDFVWVILQKKYRAQYTLWFTLLKHVWQTGGDKAILAAIQNFLLSATVIANAILKSAVWECGSALYRCHTFGSIAFSVDVPVLWNSLPSETHITPNRGHIQVSPEKLPVN